MRIKMPLTRKINAVADFGIVSNVTEIPVTRLRHIACGEVNPSEQERRRLAAILGCASYEVLA